MNLKIKKLVIARRIADSPKQSTPYIVILSEAFVRSEESKSLVYNSQENAMSQEQIKAKIY